MIKTRFSPSPTGKLHLGNVRAALFSALYAKKMQGRFILRIEDTDEARSQASYADLLQTDLQWLGLAWQEGPGVGGEHGPYFQSQRHEIYAEYYQQLEKMDLAYPCFCTDQQLALNRKLQLSRGQPPRYPGTCKNLTAAELADLLAQGKKPALRFKVPKNEKVAFTDLVKGPQVFNSDDIGDFIIRRAEGTASFMYCNAIDDALMQVTHVLRGEDHLANTPRQLMILNALNLTPAQYGHLSLIIGEDGGKLSKRGGSFSLNDLKDEGFLPLAVANYLARLSHTYDNQTLMSFDELATHFNVERLSRSAARFDQNQLMHWQKEAVLRLTDDEIWHWLGATVKNKISEPAQQMFVTLIRANVCTPLEAQKWVEIFSVPKLTFTATQQAVLSAASVNYFETLKSLFNQHGLDVKAIFADMKTALQINGKNLFQPIRLALTGEEHGPELINIVSILGLAAVQKRIDDVIELIKE